MAVKILATRICDRCKKAIDQKVIEPNFEGKLPSPNAVTFAVVREHADPAQNERLAAFTDLCPSCEGAIENLVQRILMRDPKPTDAKAEAGAQAGATGSGDATGAATPARRRKANEKVSLEGSIEGTTKPEGEKPAADTTTPTAEGAASAAEPSGGGVEFPPDPSADTRAVESADEPF
jgi:hypothetical protein